MVVVRVCVKFIMLRTAVSLGWAVRQAVLVACMKELQTPPPPRRTFVSASHSSHPILRLLARLFSSQPKVNDLSQNKTTKRLRRT